jgi:hypothetical protein
MSKLTSLLRRPPPWRRQSTGEVVPESPGLANDSDQRNRYTALQRFAAADKFVDAVINQRQGRRRSIAFPNLEGSQSRAELRSKINSYFENWKPAIDDQTLWIKCCRSLEYLLVALSPFAKYVDEVISAGANSKLVRRLAFRLLNLSQTTSFNPYASICEGLFLLAKALLLPSTSSHCVGWATGISADEKRN